jgi:hypothetical protein
LFVFCLRVKKEERRKRSRLNFDVKIEKYKENFIVNLGVHPDFLPRISQRR